MMSRKEKLLEYPWQKQHYDKHRNNVKTATSLVDRSAPPEYQHIKNKLKKLQNEKERISIICNENIRLLQNLIKIMETKRMPDFWKEPRPNFLGRETLFEIYGTRITTKNEVNTNKDESIQCVKCERRKHNK